MFNWKENFMKRKRIGAAFMLALCMIFASVGTVVASTTDYLDSPDHYLTLSAYISGLEGPLWYEDKVWYTASLTGSDVYLTVPPSSAGMQTEYLVFVQPGTDKKTLDPVYLWYGHQLIGNSDTNGAACGFGGKEARLYMWVSTIGKTICTPLDK